jgi:hypothetical protein
LTGRDGLKKFSKKRFYKSKSSTIPADWGSIVEQNKNITEINTPKGEYI